MEEKERLKKYDLNLLPRKDAKELITGVMVFMAMIAAAYLIYFGIIKGFELGDPAAWGQFGDYFGGVLNPFLSLFALLVLLITLRANIVALKQNQEILEASKEELILTRKQIENTENALKSQTEIVRANAQAERLALYAERVYQEIKLLINHGPNTMVVPVVTVTGKLAFAHIGEALNMRNTDFASTLQATDPRVKGFVDKKSHWGMRDFISKLEELDKLCSAAAQVVTTSEMAKYYQARLYPWANGLVLKGYCSEDQLRQLL